jgi:hypothetical protein
VVLYQADHPSTYLGFAVLDERLNDLWVEFDMTRHLDASDLVLNWDDAIQYGSSVYQDG